MKLEQLPKHKQIDPLKYTWLKTFRSQKYAAKIMKVNPNHIRRAIREPLRTCGGFKWRYVNN